MKRKLLIASAFILSLGTVMAQEEMDAYKFSQRELRGTARFMSMGGAFGALGGDASAISINPAGIGVYKSSEVVTTLNLQNKEVKTNSQTSSMKEKKFKADFNNLSFIGTFPLHNDVAPLLNVGFSYNRVKSFNKKYRSLAIDQDNSVTDLMAYRSGNVDPSRITLGNNISDRDYTWDNELWLPLLGYNGSLIQQVGDQYESTFDHRPDQALLVTEKGAIDKFDFNIGTTFADVVSAGITVSVYDIDYRMRSSYLEDFYDGNQNMGGFDLDNYMKTEGTGWQVALGLIIKPIDEFRIGIAYHTPTWYDMTDRYGVRLGRDIEDLTNVVNNPLYSGNKAIMSYDGTMDAVTDYELRSPDYWTFSLAGVIGKKAILSLDYELTDYKKMKLSDRHGNEFGEISQDIKRDYRLASTIRLGAEYRITPQFAVRAGYSWEQTPIDKKSRNLISDHKIDMFTAGSVTQYVLDGDTHNITWGLGYRFTKNVYSDIAFVLKEKKGDLYTHDFAKKISMKRNTFQGALTLGFRF